MKKICFYILMVCVFFIFYYLFFETFDTTEIINSDDKIVETYSCEVRSYYEYDGTIVFLNFNDLIYNKGASIVEKKSHYDENAIPLHNYQGALNYHPVFLAQHALHLIDVYNTTGNTEYLNSAKLISNKLVSISVQKDSSIFFPYNFNFPLHGYKMDTMISPWYSAMAQGQVLSLFVRLYEITEDKAYLNISQSIVNSFGLSHYNKAGDPWITCVDSAAYLWLEEYPHTPPAYTLNGMMFAIFGLYDYYRVTKDVTSEKLLRGAIKTIKENINKYRTENGISQYCLRHPKIQSLKYHNIHINQLNMMYMITGDGFFRIVANNFIQDTK